MNFDGFSPWLRLDPNLLHPLVENQAVVHLRRKQPIFYQGDMPRSVYVVKEGRVCITTYSQSGIEQQLYIAEQGALFGEHSSLLEIPHTTSAVSIVDSTIYAIPLHEFQAKLEEFPELTKCVLQIISRKNSLLIKRLLSQSSYDSLQRIAQALLDISQEYGIQSAEGVEISIRFSHQDVANLLHTSRVTVTKAFQFLTQKGIIVRKKSHIVICDMDALYKLTADSWQP